MQKATIAQNLLLHRKQKHLTQEQLSESSGVAVRTIQRIENAKVEPHVQTLTLLAQSLEIEVQELSYSPVAAIDVSQSITTSKKWLLLLHLLPAVGIIIPFANVVFPLILWAYKRDESPQLDAQGRAVINFHLTITLVLILGLTLLVLYFYVGLVLLLLTVVGALLSVFRNTQRVLQNRPCRYPLSLKFL